MLKFKEYENSAHSTAEYPLRGKFGGLLYTALGLCGESGEFAEKVKKIIRDDGSTISAEKRKELLKELGDILWYIVEAAFELRSSLEEVARLNAQKLKDRKERSVISGSGDNR